ncbi:MAG: TRAP transporter substrate-binding protein DctP [Peptococcaceae bacterium]|nr:TRAP transporter substrate-binding protein DctP [Peptococcaceae bacterium]
MKKTLAVLALLLMFSFIVTGCGDKKDTPAQSTKQQVITLKMADIYPVTHIYATDVAKFFINRVEELTQGRVKIEYYPAEQLGKQKDLLNLTSQGVADIGYMAPTVLAGQLPLNTVMALPNYTTSSQGSKIYWKLANGVLMDEFKKYGVRPVYAFTTPQYDVCTVKKEVKKPEDLKGLKLRTPGGIYDKIAQAYGVTPVVIPTTEVYEATQRGVVEGFFMNYVTMNSYKLNELVKYSTMGARFGAFPIVECINEKTWEKMPEDVKKAIMQAGEETSMHAGEVNDREAAKLAGEFEKKGLKLYRLSPEEEKLWKEPIKDLSQIWIEEMEKKGLPGKKVYEEFDKVCKEVVR